MEITPQPTLCSVLFSLFWFLEPGFHVAQVGTEHNCIAEGDLEFLVFLPVSAGITGLHHHTYLWDIAN